MNDKCASASLAGEKSSPQRRDRRARVCDSVFLLHSNRARFLLRHRWLARSPPRFFSEPPLDEIRGYFGEKVSARLRRSDPGRYGDLSMVNSVALRCIQICRGPTCEQRRLLMPRCL
eukprot:6204314-Pleurochrysis_carterae.AAC.1